MGSELMIDHPGCVDSTVNMVLFINTVGVLSPELLVLCEILMQEPQFWG